MTLPDSLLAALHHLGVRDAFGLVGGAIAPFCDALGRSPIRSVQTRHEGGALFSAVEASLATGRPTLAFVTTGPGLLNALNGAVAARWEGAHVLLVSGATSPAQRGRWAVQESGPATLPDAVYRPGALFDDAELLDTPAALERALERLARGFARPGGYVAHFALPIALQRAPATDLDVEPVAPVLPLPPAAQLDEAAAALAAGPFAIWVGHGARHAGEAVRALAEHTGAVTIATPRGKGVLPDGHPLMLGVTGCGGEDHVEAALAARGVRRILVLGSKLGEFSSCWAPGLAPPDGFVHVDLDPTSFGAAYPGVPTLGLVGDAGRVAEALRERLPAGATVPVARPAPTTPPSRGPVLPQEVLAAIQEVVIDGSDATVLAESGNAFLWANNLLRVPAAGRYRVSGLWGSMGHATSGVVGLAATQGTAVALVGDGAMLMMNEVSTAVHYRMPAVWVVLNDARMGIVEKGMAGLGLQPFETTLPPTDFAAMATSMGAEGLTVRDVEGLRPALRRALASGGPVVVDVHIDPDEPSPFARRVSTLQAMGNAR